MRGRAFTGLAGVTAVALTLLIPVLSGHVDTARAQSASESASPARIDGGVPLSQLIATVAKKTGKKFVIDPRVGGNIVLIGQEPANVSYNDLLTILHVHDFTAVEYGDYVNVIPEAGVRQQPLPFLTGKENYPDAEFVSAVITLKNVPAAQLVPIMRPMLPQVAHLAALPCTNTLILVATYAVVRRFQSIISTMDVGEPYKQANCDGYMPQNSGPPPRTPGPEHADSKN